MRTSWRVAAFVVGMGAFLTTPVRADPIALNAGVIDVAVNNLGSFVGGLWLSGDRGFTLLGPLTGGFASPPFGGPMLPGATVTLNGSAAGLEIGGTATLDGVTYTTVGGLDSIGGAYLRLIAQITLPAVFTPPSSVAAPFALNFTFGVFGQQEYPFFGSGTATVYLTEEKGFDVPGWRITRVRAELSSAPPPVPEPATLLLAGGGLAWVIRRRRQR